MEIFDQVNLDQERMVQLKKKGWTDLSFFALLNREEMISILGIEKSQSNLKKLDYLIEKIRAKYQPELMNWHASLEDQWNVTSGSINMDSILDFNGINAGQLTLLYGPFRSGKSQFAHQCLISVYQKFQQNLPEKIALFIDTESTFRPERIGQMAVGQGLSPHELFKKIDVISLQSLSEFSQVFPKIPEILRTKESKFLVIDSLTKLYRHEIALNNKPINSIIADLASKLNKLQIWAKQFNIPILVTSQVTAAMDDSHFFKVIPILATTLDMYIKQWILLGEIEQNSIVTTESGVRYAHLLNSQTKREQIIKFQITMEGIKDYF
ncbi:hypothetical protein [Candidatus Lokiarchaeum ossiferum]